MKKINIILFILLIFSIKNYAYQWPVIEEKPDTIFVHDYQLIDNYAWLKDRSRDNPEIIAFLETENDCSENWMKTTESLQDSLNNEYIARLDVENISVPVKIDSFFYYTRQTRNSQYELHCRKKNSLEAKEEIYFNENLYAEDKDFFSIYALEISPDHKKMAFTVDTNGSEEYTLRILNLETQLLLPDSIFLASDIVWSNDNKMIFYTLQDPSGRTDKVMRHIIGDDPINDVLVFKEKDQAFYVDITKSRSNDYFFITSESQITSQSQFLSTDNPTGEFQIIAPKINGEIYNVTDNNNRFIISTNRNGSYNYEIVETPIASPQRENWVTRIPHDPNIKISILVFQDFFVLTQMKNGKSEAIILDKNFNNIDQISFSEDANNFYPISSYHYRERYFRYCYESFISPYTVFSYDLDTGKNTILKQYKIPEDFSAKDYVTYSLEAPANDGTMVPISLVMRADLQNNSESSPLLLEAYGAYGDTFFPDFSTTLLSLLNRGFIYAIAHVRGGSEKGTLWYEQGKLLNKKNTFNDFINCAEFLINEGYTSPEKLVAKGGSAGGLLMGVVANERPDLFKTIIADVPFVDLIYSMLDPSLSAVVSEYEEWGNPNIKQEFDYMFSYCPYINVKPLEYPNILATTGFYDTRVDYWGPLKWVTKLRKNNLSNNIILMKTEMNSGHAGDSGILDYYREISFEQAFILKSLGLR